METNNKALVNQLNSLMEINNDRVEGYERAAKETKETDLRSLFTEMASHSRDYRTELSAEIKSLGGEPTQGTRTSGKIYRVWMDIKAALTGKDKKAIVSACEFGEDAALEAYDEVLKSASNFTPRLREMIVTQKHGIRQDHDKIKALRDSIKV